jgi:hypothetical protein
MSEGELARPVNPGRRAHETLARLLAVDWTGNASFDHVRSRARLMREYLRRASWWAQVVHAIEEWPFFDIAAHLAPQVHLADPFDPLLWLFERGGGWTTESGFIELGGASVRRRSWRDHLSTEPIVTLTMPAFDALDQALLRKLGSRPNR